jgi:hypothetical protein
MLGAMASASGQFREIDYGTRLRAMTLLLSYGFGAPLLPAVEEEAVAAASGVQVIKRIILSDGRVVDKPFEGDL